LDSATDRIVIGDPRRLGLEWRFVPSPEGDSAETRTAGIAKFFVGGQCVSSNADTHTGIAREEIELPLVDLAWWFAESWITCLFDESIPKALVNRPTKSLAERWESSQALQLRDVDRDELYRWAETHCLEFASTDYCLPNVVFQRVDDYMEVSWFPRSDTSPGCPIAFRGSCGAILIPIKDAIDLFSSAVSIVNERTCDLVTDPRVYSISQVARSTAAQRATSALGKLLSIGARLSKWITDDALDSFGNTGIIPIPVLGLLRSAAGSISEDDCLEVLELLSNLAGGEAVRLNLHSISANVAVDIDPIRPWDSGIRAARLVRNRLLEIGIIKNGMDRMDILGIMSSLGIIVCRKEFAPSIEGVCVMRKDGAALCVTNPRGRLAKTISGERSTLAHEFCHLLFDVNMFCVLGQVDRRQSGGVLEKRANAFAAELLLPREKVLAASAAGRINNSELVRLARQHGVSIDLAVHQAQNQGLAILGRQTSLYY